MAETIVAFLLMCAAICLYFSGYYAGRIRERAEVIGWVTDSADNMAVEVISDALDKARAEERAAIAAWIRQYADRDSVHDFMTKAVNRIADLIEQGAPGASR